MDKIEFSALNYFTKNVIQNIEQTVKIVCLRFVSYITFIRPLYYNLPIFSSKDNILDSPKEGSDTKESFISSVGESANSYRASCMYPYPVRIPRKIVLMR